MKKNNFRGKKKTIRHKITYVDPEQFGKIKTHTVYLRLQFATRGVGVLTLVRGLQCLAVCHDQQMISTAPTS
jgi:mRNA degradation ribonuclease J1/J2